MTCPWYVSAHAVDRYLLLTGRSAVRRDTPEWDDASDQLIELAAETWRRYQADPTRTPQIDRHGRYVYRTPRPQRMRLIVEMARRPEGPKPQLISVDR